MDNVSHKTKPSVRVLCLPERNITFQKRLFRAKKIYDLTLDIYVALQLMIFSYFEARAIRQLKKPWQIDRTVLLKDRTVLFKARKLRPWERKKADDRSVLLLTFSDKSVLFIFWKTELSFSAKLGARSVLFPIIYSTKITHPENSTSILVKCCVYAPHLGLYHKKQHRKRQPLKNATPKLLKFCVCAINRRICSISSSK